MQQLGVAIGPRWPTPYHVDRTIVGERGDRSAGGLIPAAAASIEMSLRPSVSRHQGVSATAAH
jgi:hypothetical protein